MHKYIKQALLITISSRYPFPIKKIQQVYDHCQSIDQTVNYLDLACQLAKDPLQLYYEMHEEVSLPSYGYEWDISNLN